MRAAALLSAVALAAGLIAAGCRGRDSAAPITIGVLAQCMGTFSSLYEPTLAAAELPVLQRGGTLVGTVPSRGVIGPVLAGHRLRLVLGCPDGSAQSTISEARRLVESLGAQIVIGPLVPAEALALRRYADGRPETTFVFTPSTERSVTFDRPRANVFRFTSDSAQLVAGLGGYAYRRLGWRRAVVLGEPTSFDYGEAAGFVAEFCALGGVVVRRLWVAPGANVGRAVTAVRKEGVDGAIVLALTAGVDLTRAFAPRGALRTRVVVDGVLSGALVSAFGARAQGVAWAWPNATDPPTAAWRTYRDEVRKRFPNQPATTYVFAVDYYTSMEAVLRALEKIHGDLSDTHRFRARLAATDFESPLGPLRLDRNRQVVATNQVALVDLKRGARTVRIVGGVDESFGGYFHPADPPPGPNTPSCRRGNPPPWVR